jgi:NAD-dependent dihydropyrimidine dehydrogenase PreA subunit
MSGLVYLRGVTTLALDDGLCTGCGTCELVCPHAVFAMTNGFASIRDLDACMECGACSRNCETGAITVAAGVGCATAVINAALGREDACCCVEDEAPLPSSQSSGCC